jgi:solute carrier family 30 (zinc transporter), member 2
MTGEYERLGEHVICGFQHLESIIAQEAEAPKPSSTRALWCAVAFSTVMMLVEAVGGVISGSLAVLCDAVHMLADVFTILISLFAAYASAWEANDRYSFAWRRAEVIGALASVSTTWALVVWITISAFERMPEVLLCAMDEKRQGCEVLETPLMMGLGCFGFFMNVLLTSILFCGGVHAHSHGSLFDHDHDHDHSHSHGGHEHEHSHTRANAHSQGEHGHSYGGCEESGEHVHIAGSQHDLQQAATRGSLSVRATRQSNAEAPPQGAMNQRAALLHVFGDCLQALGVVVAAGLTWAGNEWKHHTSSTAHSFFNLADPLLSLAFGIITICTTKHLVKETWQILMERVPPVLSYADFVDELLLEDAVSEVLDLHIWMVGPSLSVLCATLSTAEELPPVEAQRLVERLTDRCMEMGAQHCTFQLEYSQHARTDDAPMQA